MSKKDPFEKFTHALCELLDSVSDMPCEIPMQFTIEVKKVNNNYYHLSNPLLKEAKLIGENGIILQ
jgi:hypothetical protein